MDEWHSFQKINIHPSLLTAGKETQVEELRKFLRGNCGLRAIRASTKREALAFILACAKQFDKNDRENFFSKGLIVDTPGNFRAVVNNLNSLILISTFDDHLPLYNAVSKGHYATGLVDGFFFLEFFIHPLLEILHKGRFIRAHPARKRRSI